MIEENEHLEETKIKYEEVIEDSNLKLNHLQEIYKGDKEGLLNEKYRLETKISKITKQKDKPYFARIDFSTDTNKEICYISKIGVSDYDNNIITVDWRAPIASLYYDSNIGACKYNSPEGIINGTLNLKRQYNIENGNLIDYADVDTVSNDEILKPYLNASADNRLKNIVSTIQSEQNEIIRENINKNLIIQGVAGSGKTTVALHRIAYLVYNHQNYKPEDFMVIGPNKFFVNYISGILPDLDVNNVLEYTLEEIFENYVKNDYEINNGLDNIKDHDEIANYKTSIELKEDIDKYFNELEIIPIEDLKIENITIISRKKIIEIYDSINKNIFSSIKSQIDKVIILLLKEINTNKDKIVIKLINNNIDNKIIENFKNNPEIYVRKHFKILNSNINIIYATILKNKNIYFNPNIKNINIEDIPALTYIKYKLNGNKEYNNIKHVVIDEAQDYGAFTFYSLKCILPNATFSIYGDLAQSLYSYRSIKSWDEIKNIFNKAEIKHLSKSYRTTIEIMTEANKINRLLKLDEAIPVIRHGKKVQYKDDNIINIINNLQKDHKQIAIITKDIYSATSTYEKIKNKYDCNLITSKNINYDNKINILPNYLSKGLEFDAVIITNIKDYKKNSILDMKLLYVSMTRALHELIIITS